MLLPALQSLLRDLYALEVGYDIADFVTTDADLARALDSHGRPAQEKLLIAQIDGAADVCLYLDDAVLARLEHNDPLTRLTADNLGDFWTAFEGVSHFMYFAFNAELEKPVTLLEMELQAEVDKFVATSLLLARQGERPQRALHHWLFELPQLDAGLSYAEVDRYRSANRYAGKYCRALAPAIARSPADPEVTSELRRFYRWSQTDKIAHIERR